MPLRLTSTRPERVLKRCRRKQSDSLRRELPEREVWKRDDPSIPCTTHRCRRPDDSPGAGQIQRRPPTRSPRSPSSSPPAGELTETTPQVIRGNQWSVTAAPKAMDLRQKPMRHTAEATLQSRSESRQ